jgi:hypothetical protein
MLKNVPTAAQLKAYVVTSLMNFGGFLNASVSAAIESLSFRDTAPSIDGTITDERPGVGASRTLQPHRCYDFDGLNDHVDTGVVLSTSRAGGRTFSLWLRYSGTPVRGERVLSNIIDDANAHGYEIWINQNGNIAFLLSTTSGSDSDESGPILNDDQWHHVVVIDDGSGLDLWVDGVFERPISNGGSILGTFPSIWLGNSSRSDNPYDGKLFDVRIYDSALTEAQILELYTEGAAALPDVPTVAHYKCDDQHPTLAFDSSGNGNHGTKTSIDASVGAFHYEGADVPFSWENEVGFSPLGDNRLTSSFDLWTTAEGTFGSSSESGATGVTGEVYQFTESSSSGYQQAASPAATTGAVTSRATVWLKKTGNDARYVCVIPINTSSRYSPLAGYTIVDLVSGELTDTDTYSSPATISDVGNGWYKVTVDVSPDTAGSTGFAVRLLNAPTIPLKSTSEGDYLGNGSNGFLIQFPKLQEVYHTPRDESATSNDVYGGTLQYTGKAPAAPIATKAMCGQGDGTSAYVTAGKRLTTGAVTELTACCWFKEPVGAASPTILMNEVDYGLNQRQWQLAISTDNKIELWVNREGTSTASPWRTEQTNTALEVDVWNHVAAVYEAGEITLYVNGIEQDTTLIHTATVNAIFDGTANFNVFAGESNGAAANPVSGAIADSRLYSNALSASEILFIATGGSSGTDPGSSNLLCHYPLSEGAGTVIHDISGNDNHGTAMNIVDGQGAGEFWGETQDVYHANLANGFTTATLFDGVDDLVTTDVGATANSDDRSLSLNFSWAGGHIGTIISTRSGGGNGWVLRVNTDGQLDYFHTGGSQLLSNVNDVQPNKIHQLTLTKVGTSVVVTLDGVEVINGTATGGINSSTSPAFGITPYSSAQPFKGMMWNIVYTEDGVTNTYPGGVLGWGNLVTSLRSVSIPLPVAGTQYSHPAGPYHNGAESHLDFTGGVAREANAFTRANAVPVAERENFNTGWVRARATVDVDAIEAPDGTLTGNLLIADSSLDTNHYLRRENAGTFVPLNTRATFSCYAKASYSTIVMIRINDDWAAFDLISGALLDISDDSGEMVVKDSVSVGNGWWRLAIESEFPASNDRLWIFPMLADEVDVTTTIFPGNIDGEGLLYLWGAKLEVGTQATPYHPVNFDPSLDADYEFGDALVNPHFKRISNKNGVAHQEDRFMQFSDPMLGEDLTAIQTYTQSREL